MKSFNLNTARTQFCELRIAIHSSVYGVMALFLMAFAGSAWSADRIQLDNTSIVGTRELPKVLYIVPWKSTRLGTLAGVSENASFEDGLVALDREVFQKEAEYYDILYGSADTPVK